MGGMRCRNLMLTDVGFHGRSLESAAVEFTVNRRIIPAGLIHGIVVPRHGFLKQCFQLQRGGICYTTCGKAPLQCRVVMGNHFQREIACALRNILEGQHFLRSGQPDGEFLELSFDSSDQAPVVLLLEALKKVTEPPEFLRCLEYQKPASRCPQQDAHVRELAGKRFVHVAQEAETVGLETHWHFRMAMARCPHGQIEFQWQSDARQIAGR
jgi:hypothetical protein